MLYVFEITILNGKKTIESHDKLITPEEKLDYEKKLSKEYGYDVYVTYAMVKDAEDADHFKAQRWVRK